MKVALVTILVFVLYLLLMGMIPTLIAFEYSAYDVTYLLFCMICTVPICAAMWWLHGGILEPLGLKHSVVKGLAYAAISSAPLLLYVVIFKRWNAEISTWYLVNATLLAGFFEELLFRGLLFGNLFRYAKWGFLPAVLIVSVIFGLLHIYQGKDAVTAVLAAVVTGLGSLLFAWIYVETNYNLWSNIFLHILMNFSWTAFAASNNGALGNIEMNIARLAVIVIAIVLVIIYKRKYHQPYLINRKTLWSNNT